MPNQNYSKIPKMVNADGENDDNDNDDDSDCLW